MSQTGPIYVGSGGFSDTAGYFTSLSNAEGSGSGDYAVWSTTTRNQTAYPTGANFDCSAVPSGADIDSIYIEIRHKVPTGGGSGYFDTFQATLGNNGSPLGSAHALTESGTDYTDYWTVDCSGLGLTGADIASTLTVDGFLSRINTSSATECDWDWISVTINWTGAVQNADVDLETANIWVEGVASIPSIQPDTSSTFSVTEVSGAAEIPAPEVQLGAAAGVTAVAATVSIPSPGISTGSTISVTAVSALSEVPNGGVSAGSSISLGSVNGVAAITQPAVATVTSATPSSVDSVIDIPATNILRLQGYVGTGGSSGIDGNWSTLANAEGATSDTYASGTAV